MPEYRTPGVYIEEISGGPRPISASSTTDTGFVGVLTLPTTFLAGTGPAAGMYLPAAGELPQLTWNRAMAFRPLLGGPAPEAAAPADEDPKNKGKAKAAPAADGNKLEALVQDLLPGKWSIDAPTPSDDAITLRDDKGAAIRVPVRRTLVSVKTKDNGEKEWDLSWGADENQMMQLIAGKALPLGYNHSGSLNVVDAKKSATIDATAIHDALAGTAPACMSVDSFEAWRKDLGENIFVEILLQANKGMTENQAHTVWETLPGASRAAWDKWLRSHPGMLRLELAITGFFSNGGKTAYPAVAIQSVGTAGPGKRRFLEDSFDGVSAVAMLAAPGLDFSWQQGILEYAGPSGRGDLFAVLEAPRYLLTKQPRHIKLNAFRWIEADAPYEVSELQVLSSPAQTELRFGGYSADEILDRAVPRDTSGYGAAYAPWLVVDNPVSTGPHDRFVIAPPAGHVAGVIAATDLKPGGGVWKAPANEQLLGAAELVTSISDKEQESLNVKGINIIRWRPMAGIRIWGARTIASDPLWTYISVRRLFLFVERSVRDAVTWAVFLPNVPGTRSDLKTSIGAFLYQLWSQGALDGASWSDAFSVRCDAENNPDVDVRSGLLTVDVEMRPVYPAEFVRIRFRQSPMKTEVGEG
jgi:hypothetical protein